MNASSVHGIAEWQLDLQRRLGQPVVAHGFVYVGKVTTSLEGSVLQALHK